MKWFIAIMVLAMVFIAGCTQQQSSSQTTQYVCPDGSTVSNPSLCPQTQTPTPQPYCGDGSCNNGETCSSCSTDCGQCPIPSTVVIPSKQYGPNQLSGCEDGSISIGGTIDRDLCYRYFAAKENNYLYCEQISDISKKDDCYMTIGQITKNTYVCDLISTTSGCQGNSQDVVSRNMLSCKDACYESVAISNLNSGICNSIITQTGRDSCYWRVGINGKDSNSCSKIIDSGTKDSCYHNVAVQTNNINICSPISNAETHDICMMTIIRNLKLKDLTLCNQMTTSWKTSCNYEISTGNYLT